MTRTPITSILIHPGTLTIKKCIIILLRMGRMTLLIILSVLPSLPESHHPGHQDEIDLGLLSSSHYYERDFITI